MSFEKVKKSMEEMGITEYLHHRDITIDTVEHAAQCIGCTEAEIAKTMSFMVGEKPIVVVMAGDYKANNGKFKAKFGCKANMIQRDMVETLIGHAPGGVCPFALNPGVEVYLDESLLRFEMVHIAAGDDYNTVDMDPRIIEKYVDFKGWVDIGKPIEE